MFFGALASVQLRSRRTQSVSGRVGCGGYTRGSLQEFNRTQNFWNTICWSGDFTTEQILAWDAECCAHYNAISACWCPSPPLRGMCVRLCHLRQKVWSSLERLSQPFHVHFSSSGMYSHVHFDGGSCQLQFAVWIRGRWFASVSF